MDTSMISTLVAGVAVGLTALPAYNLLRQKLKPGGAWSSINRPTSEPTHERALPSGKHPLQLYSLATPNGQKVTIALEEAGLKYDAYMINIMKGEQFSTGFVEVNPNGKIPALLDREGPGGKPVRVFESGASLLYLAEKSGRLLPKDPALRVEAINWLFHNIGSAPFVGQYGHFARYAPVKIAYGIARYEMETKRLLDVLDRHLGRPGAGPFLAGDEFTIADCAWFPWVRGLSTGYKADSVFQVSEKHAALSAWLKRIEERPSVQKGLKINSSQEGGYPEYHSE